MSGAAFLRLETILVLMLGVVAFSLVTVAGVLLGKPMSAPSGRKINSIIGACRVAGFPMSSSVAKKLRLETNPHNHPLMQVVGANTADQIASAIAGRVMLMLVPMFS